MSDAVKPSRRRYDASGRRARAQRTREEVVAAARRLLERDGYAEATIAAIAREARVSPETIYKAFGSKGALVGAVLRAAVRGDEGETPLRRRPAIDAIRAEPDPRRALERYGTLLTQTQPRLAPLLRALRASAAADPDVAAALRRLDDDRLDGMREFAAHLDGIGALRPGVSKQEARDVLWTLNAPELFELLVERRGWSVRRYGRWVAQALAAALLP
jgi:AcrR family transcriptional regulator